MRMSGWRTASLVEAKEWLRGVAEDGAECPCCGQFAKVYRRKLNSGMAASLVRMYRLAGTAWVHLPTELPARSREEGKLAYWGLAEESTEPREDGGRAGWWHVTDRGERFVRREVSVPRFAIVYDGKPLRLEGEPITILDSLGDKFDYDELMGVLR